MFTIYVLNRLGCSEIFTEVGIDMLNEILFDVDRLCRLKISHNSYLSSETLIILTLCCELAF